MFGVVYGEKLEKAEKAAEETAKLYNLPTGIRLKTLLFAIHTFYAFLMKLIAIELLALQRDTQVTSFVGGLSALDDAGVKAELSELESGSRFRDRGITNFLGDRFGYEGPFTGFPQKEEYYRRAREEELLWLSITEPDQKRFLRQNIMFRNRVACALADVVFVPFAEKGNKTLVTVKQVLRDGVPMFTCQYSDDRATDVNKDLFALGVPAYTRKTVGKCLESLGVTVDAPPPFPSKPAESLVVRESPLRRKPRARQTNFRDWA